MQTPTSEPLTNHNRWQGSITMVEAMEITKVGVRDRLVVDLRVAMGDPDDHDFKPRASLDGNVLRITNEGYADEFASEELDEESFEAAERDRFVELRIRFTVGGMHGTLIDVHPLPADSRAKKLAEATWKTVIPLM